MNLSAVGAVKAMHDEWLAKLPAGEVHDCPMCHLNMEDLMTDTLSQADVDRAVADAVAAATAPLNAELDALRAAALDADTAQAVAAATAGLNDKIAELQAELDTKVAELKTATDAIAARDAADKEAADKAAADALRDERVAAAKDIKRPDGSAYFPEAHCDAQADRWASFTDEQWTDQLAEYTALADAATGPAAPAPPPPPAGEPLVTGDRKADPATDVRAARRELLGGHAVGDIDLTRITQ